jgi:hypothetical protein|tara:strand:+ start:4736 stop:4963 length:228 start_codon:yes stop_codon:yes gene_type:complete
MRTTERDLCDMIAGLEHHIRLVRQGGLATYTKWGARRPSPGVSWSKDFAFAFDITKTERSLARLRMMLAQVRGQV